MEKKARVIIRRWKEEDIDKIIAIQQAAYPNFARKDLCDRRNYQYQLNAFPEGQLLAEVADEIVGYATSLIVQIDDQSPWYSYAEITGLGTFSTHNPSGDTLYGADIAVLPEWRGKAIAGKLYNGRKKILQRFNLKRMVAGGRIPGYADYAGKLTPEAYIEQVKRGAIKDIALSAHLKAGYLIKGVHMDYLDDAESLNYATFLELENPKYDEKRHRLAVAPIKAPVRKVRICSAQYQMRRINNWEEFVQQSDFFIQTANEYHSHFLLFPELFTAQLFSAMDKDLSTLEAVHNLTQLTDKYIDYFRAKAQETGLFIIAGSHPVVRDEKIYNIAHLFTPSGNIYTQDKLHITPGERIHWGISPGEGIKIFDTGHARIAIQVCYDIEFPEISRLLTLAGVEIIFVPFSTDERKAYMRVRYSAHARAVENMVYVVLSGNIGNLPQVSSFLINYGQAAVLTPSDIGFPLNGIMAEAESNTETVVFADLDLANLGQQRELGSVTPLLDRRSDLYELRSKNKIEIIRTT
ncbi:MAG: GNAT family N-acetyltransferase [Saprospiraceae bacterium]|nr:GNAT family N-acetyltransferase [Saprospiraceae bacterium]